MTNKKILSLFEYYKTHVYEYAYNRGYDDAIAGKSDPTSDLRDIYWQDEMDYILCADYYSLIGEFDENDIKFLKALGFDPEDFENDE